MSLRARGKAERVALVVDADDAALDAVVAAFDPDLLQLHGAETPERVAAIRARLRRPVMKAIGIAAAADLAAVAAYAGVADRLLLDAKPPADAEALPGGNGVPFDWRLIAGLDAAKPVMLSGGLDGDNVAAAIALTGVRAVDVSSGVERRPGDKDPARIEAFVKAAARRASPRLQSEDKVGVTVPVQPNSFRTGPDESGHFGIFGGRFVAETLMPLILELEEAYNAAKVDPDFQRQMNARPRPTMSAARARSISPSA